MTERIDFHYSLERGDFSLDVEASLAMRGITGVFGPSGAGKTTLLRCIAGLESAARGRLAIGGDVLDDDSHRTPTDRRRIGYVFQEPRLFPHLDVRRNLEYGAKRAESNSGFSFDETVEILRLGSLLDRRPSRLSGGEAQRVAIGRALLSSPRLVLMDEPVTALDMESRTEVLPFIEALHAKAAIPILYVSHSVDETLRLCDDLLVLDGGRKLAHGDLSDVLTRRDLPVLSGEEAGSVLAATFLEYDENFDLTRAEAAGGELLLPGELDSSRPIRIRIRANDVSLSLTEASDTSILNKLVASVEAIDDDSPHSVLVRLRCGGEALSARITRRSLEELRIAPGARVIAQIKSVSVRSGRL